MCLAWASGILLDTTKVVWIEVVQPLTLMETPTLGFQPSMELKLLRVFNHPPGQETTSSPATSTSHSRTLTASLRMSLAKWAMAPRTYIRTFSTLGWTSEGGMARNRVSNRVRTAAELSDTRGRTLVRTPDVPTGLFGGLAEIWLVR